MKIVPVMYYVCEDCGNSTKVTEEGFPVGWMLLRTRNDAWSVLCPKSRNKEKPNITYTNYNYPTSIRVPVKDEEDKRKED